MDSTLILTKYRKQISDVEAINLIRLFEEDEYIQIAFSIIETHLFLNDLDVYAKNKEEIDERFAYVIKEEWSIFLQKALKHLIVLGYVVFRINTQNYITKPNDFKAHIPVIIPREFYSVYIELDKTHNLSYSIQLNDSFLNINETKNEDLMIYFLEGREPDVYTGDHNSIIKNLRKGIMRTNLIQDYYDIATQQRAHPPLLYEEIQENRIIEKDVMSDIHFFDHRNNAIVKDRNDQELQLNNPLSKKPRFTYNSSLQINPYVAKNFPQTVDDNTFKIPSGFKLATSSNNNPEPPSDYIQYFDMHRDKVFAMFQLPISLVFSQLSSKFGTSSHIDLDNNESHKLNRTLRLYQKNLIKLANQIYKEAYKNELENIEFSLEIYSPLTMSQAATLEDMNYLKTDDARKLIIRAAGLPAKYEFHGKNSHTRPRINGNENMTEPMIKARVENINMESKLFEAKIDQINAEIKALKNEVKKPQS